MAEAAPLPLADALEGVETPPAELPLDGEGPSLPRDEGISSSGRGEEGGTEWHEMPFVREGSSSSPPWRRLGPPSISGEPSGSDHGGGWVSCATGTRDTALRVLSEARDAWVASWAAAQAWLTTEQQPTSRYVALIPLSDERLKPRNTKLIVGILMLFALILAIAVFFLVPRGISIGKITIHSDKMSWNKTLRTFQLDLNAEIPIINPNYWQTTVFGRLRVVFFDAETGAAEILASRVPARSDASEIQVTIDASNVPSNYTLTIMEHCLGTLEPRTLVFFLKGRLHASYLYTQQDLTEIDTYFMIDCVFID